MKRKCRCKRDIHSIIHTTRLCFICFLFETFTTHIPQLNFYFSLFFFQASIHFLFLFFSFTSNIQNRCFFSIFSIHIFFYACSVFLFFFKSCGTYQFFFVLPNLFLPHPKWMLLTFYGKRTIIKIFRVVKKKIFEISLYFKLRFNCLSSKGLTNTLSAHR